MPNHPQEDSPPRARMAGALRSAWHGLGLVWATSRPLTLALATATVAAGAFPAIAAYAARFVVDAVVGVGLDASGGGRDEAFRWLALEGALITGVLVAQRTLLFCEALLRVRLAHGVRRSLLDKAIELRLADFEQPAVHDRMDEVRREAMTRPLDLVSRTFALARYGLAIGAYFYLLLQFSPWAVLALVVTTLPGFVAEARYSEQAFRFFRAHSPENRERNYLETLLTREEFKKEVDHFELGRPLIKRYEALFRSVYEDDRALAMRRHGWGIGLGVLASGAFFTVYAWIIVRTMDGMLTLGQMTMYLVVFRQAQSAISAGLSALSGLYEDHLYFQNLESFLALEGVHGRRDGTGGRAGLDVADGLRVEGVSYRYPGERARSVNDVSFHLRPGETLALVGPNGGGKSTLVKLIAGAYPPDEGRITLYGLPLEEWSPSLFRAQVSILFQDYLRLKLTAGENIGLGDVDRMDDDDAIADAARRAGAESMLASLPHAMETRLGKSFRGAHELSWGEWQRLALARALMNRDPGLVVMDEPTSAADPERQAAFMERMAEVLEGRMGIVVSHRLATARLATRILVLQEGRVLEEGSHEALLEEDGLYATLFRRQAAGYR